LSALAGRQQQHAGTAAAAGVGWLQQQSHQTNAPWMFDDHLLMLMQALG
jgi:hypothetical protein